MRSRLTLGLGLELRFRVTVKVMGGRVVSVKDRIKIWTRIRVRARGHVL